MSILKQKNAASCRTARAFRKYESARDSSNDASERRDIYAARPTAATTAATTAAATSDAGFRRLRKVESERLYLTLKP